MRSNIDPQTIERLMTVLGKEARGSGAVFLHGVPALYSLAGELLRWILIFA